MLRIEMPETLSGAAAEVWLEVCAHLESLGVLSSTDAIPIARYCEDYVLWLKCQKHIEEYGVMYPLKSEDGTVADVAKALGVHERTVYQWKKRGMPGEAGEYDVDEILAWREEHSESDATPVESERAKLLSIERRQRELKLFQTLGDVAPVDPWFRRMTRRVNEAKAVLSQLPDMITAVVEKAQCPREVVARVRRQAEDTVRQICEMIADLSDATDTEEAGQEDDEP